MFQTHYIYLLDDYEQAKIIMEACLYCGKYFKDKEGKKLWPIINVRLIMVYVHS